MIRLIDEGDMFVIQRTRAAVAELVQIWHEALPKQRPGLVASGMLFVHGCNCWKSICKLLLNCSNPDEMEALSNGAATILRSLHDACIQLEYILKGDSRVPLSSDELGQLYLDFEIVEKYKAVSRIDSFQSLLAKQLANSPRRAIGEPIVRSEYERVKGRYPNKTHWYKGTLADIATYIGREEDHFWLLSLYNSSVHGGPTAVRQGPTPGGADLYIVAMNILIRAANLLRHAIGAKLSPDASEVFETESDFLNLPSQRSH